MAVAELRSDEELVTRYRRSQDPEERESLFQQLFRRYERRVAIWCYRIAGDSDLAADLAQDVFVKVLGGLDSFQGGARFSTWLYAIVRNHCLNYVTRRQRFETVDEDALAAVADPVALGPFESFEQQAEHEQLLELMREHLTDVERRVMVLHYGHGIGLKPLTRLLNLTNASGAKAAIVSSRRKLQRALVRKQARDERIRQQRRSGLLPDQERE